ncbi:LacI family DNA-binding transcriptional regulator [Telluribacter sp.]|jgi:LacI family transcriptional regulator|uniref:LacI family DNA-binding transcriptional regulator n=1 Tax=Telluribacter sp. TaxID=1978767 RepID=UPI002E1277BA|nr:LacI family DNA-binding transcriptional regulator [Telluribacter sp.]
MEEISLKTIANRLGISISTVSRALRNHPDIREETKRAVVQLAEELEYEPNHLAFQLLRRKSNSIGVIVPKISYPLYAEAISGIEAVAEAQGYQLLICQSNEDYQKEIKQINSLIASRVSGIILSVSAHTTQYDHLLRIQTRNIPFVLFNRDCEQISCSKVLIDNYKAAYEAVNQLLAAGRHHIGFMGGPPHLQISLRREAGYRAALQERGITINEDLIRQVEFSREAIRQGVTNLLDEAPQLDALITYSDQIAQWALVLARQRGLRIPQDLALIGFNDEPADELLEPSLSSVRQPAYEMGAEAARLIFKELQSTKFAYEKIILESRLIHRGSTWGSAGG